MFKNKSQSKKFSLKYENVSKDYGLSKIHFTFDFIYLVLKRDASIDKAIEGVANEYGITERYLRDYLIENRYIINRSNKNEFSKSLKKYNTKALKKILKQHGLKASGKRERIESRILENNLFGNYYYLSSKSKVFYRNKKRRVRIYNEYLSQHYYFNEFNEYYMDNYRKKEDNIPVEFINKHISKSIEDKNHDSYISNNSIMAECFFKKERWRKMLEHVLKNYCMDLNPYWKINDLEQHTGINLDTYDELTFLGETLSRNTIISTYYLIWDSFNFDRIIVPKYDGYRYLKDILNQKDLNKLNRDLDERFYLNEDLKIKKIVQKSLFDY